MLEAKWLTSFILSGLLFFHISLLDIPKEINKKRFGIEVACLDKLEEYLFQILVAACKKAITWK